MESIDSYKVGNHSDHNSYRHRKLKTDSIDAITVDAQSWSNVQRNNPHSISGGTRDEDGVGDTSMTDAGFVRNALHDREEEMGNRHQILKDTEEEEEEEGFAGNFSSSP